MSTVERRGPMACGIALAVLLCGAGSASAQIPDEFTNLKLLPKDIGKRELVDIMRNFSGALGVRCKFCHVGESETSLEGYDFASDELEHKKVARAMMTMTQEINGKLLPATGRTSLLRVRCVTCHRGVEEPESLDRMLWTLAQKDSVSAAADRYRELRDEYYGSGSYDFSAGTLNSVAEKLAQQDKDVDGAIELMKLNLEHNPDAASSHLMLGQLYVAKGDKAAAIASIERSLELEPDNPYAKRALQGLRPSE